MNAIATTGMNQASLLAAFTLPVAAPATPLFANLIHLMMAPPLQDAKEPASFQGTAATPAQIADAMIRSMLGKTQVQVLDNQSPVPAAASNVLLSPASVNPPPAALPSPAIVANAPSLVPETAPDPILSAARTEAQAPAVPTDKKTLPAGAETPSQTPPSSRRLSIQVTDAAMAPVMVVTPAPAQVIPAIVPAPSPNESKASVPLAIAQNAPAGSLPLARSGVAFTAVLTPEPVLGPSATLTTTTQAAENSVQPAMNLQPAAADTAVQAGGNSQPGGDASPQQENDSPETAARPVAAAPAAKAKPDISADDSSLQATVVVHGAAVPSFSALPADASRASAPAQSNGTTPAETPYNATAEALRTTESSLPAAPPLRTGAAQEIAIRIAPPGSPAVDLRLVERGGQVHVDVRTSDAALQTNLRQDLETLSSSLERAGYHTETFTPGSTLSRAASGAQAGNHDNNQQDPSQNRGGSADSGARRQQQQKRSGTWLEELEEQS